MKFLLINQNPVVKKLVGLAGKKLNLDIENVARIGSDFEVSNYVCIIVDDESIGKNQSFLTSMQDNLKVCLLISKKTPIKDHEFNVVLRKPFLPTEILEILDECVPKELDKSDIVAVDTESTDISDDLDLQDSIDIVGMDEEEPDDIISRDELDPPQDDDGSSIDEDSSDIADLQEDEDIEGSNDKEDSRIDPNSALDVEASEVKDFYDYDFDPDSIGLSALNDSTESSKDANVTQKDNTTNDMVDSLLDDLSDLDEVSEEIARKTEDKDPTRKATTDIKDPIDNDNRAGLDIFEADLSDLKSREELVNTADVDIDPIDSIDSKTQDTTEDIADSMMDSNLPLDSKDDTKDSENDHDLMSELSDDLIENLDLDSIINAGSTSKDTNNEGNDDFRSLLESNLQEEKDSKIESGVNLEDSKDNLSDIDDMLSSTDEDPLLEDIELPQVDDLLNSNTDDIREDENDATNSIDIDIKSNSLDEDVALDIPNLDNFDIKDEAEHEESILSDVEQDDSKDELITERLLDIRDVELVTLDTDKDDKDNVSLDDLLNIPELEDGQDSQDSNQDEAIEQQSLGTSMESVDSALSDSLDSVQDSRESVIEDSLDIGDLSIDNQEIESKQDSTLYSDESHNVSLDSAFDEPDLALDSLFDNLDTKDNNDASPVDTLQDKEGATESSISNGHIDNTEKEEIRALDYILDQNLLDSVEDSAQESALQTEEIDNGINILNDDSIIDNTQGLTEDLLTDTLDDKPDLALDDLLDSKDSQDVADSPETHDINSTSKIDTLDSGDIMFSEDSASQINELIKDINANAYDAQEDDINEDLGHDIDINIGSSQDIVLSDILDDSTIDADALESNSLDSVDSKNPTDVEDDSPDIGDIEDTSNLEESAIHDDSTIGNAQDLTEDDLLANEAEDLSTDVLDNKTDLALGDLLDSKDSQSATKDKGIVLNTNLVESLVADDVDILDHTSDKHAEKDNIEELTELEVAQALGEEMEGLDNDMDVSAVALNDITSQSEIDNINNIATDIPDDKILKDSKQDHNKQKAQGMNNILDFLSDEDGDMDCVDSLDSSVLPVAESTQEDELGSNDKETIKAVKDMDADSFIQFFKDTPREKLYEILEGADISFNIHFNKK